MPTAKILIVEDKILIADNTKRFLEKKGFEVVGIAISYDEAINYIQTEQLDIILLDIRLNGSKTGIDIAEYINEKPIRIPFIFLTSQLDNNNIDIVKRTFPAGYLLKPIQYQSLYATIEIILYRESIKNEAINQIRLHDGNMKYLINMNNIQFIQAEHVYIKVYIKGEEHILHRSTLKDIQSKLSSINFVRTHRSYLVNIRHIDSWNSNSIYIDNHEIPMSRSKKKEVLEKIIG